MVRAKTLGRSLKESHVRFDDYLELSEASLRKSCQRVMSHLYSTPMTQRDHFQRATTRLDNGDQSQDNAAEKHTEILEKIFGQEEDEKVSHGEKLMRLEDEEFQANQCQSQAIAFAREAKYFTARLCRIDPQEEEAVEKSQEEVDFKKEAHQLFMTQAEDSEKQADIFPRAMKTGKTYSRLQCERRQHLELLMRLRAGAHDDRAPIVQSQPVAHLKTRQANEQVDNSSSSMMHDLNGLWESSCNDEKQQRRRVHLVQAGHLEPTGARRLQDPVALSHELSRRRFFERLEQQQQQQSAIMPNATGGAGDSTKSQSPLINANHSLAWRENADNQANGDHGDLCARQSKVAPLESSAAAADDNSGASRKSSASNQFAISSLASSSRSRALLEEAASKVDQADRPLPGGSSTDKASKELRKSASTNEEKRPPFDQRLFEIQVPANPSNSSNSSSRLVVKQVEAKNNGAKLFTSASLAAARVLPGAVWVASSLQHATTRNKNLNSPASRSRSCPPSPVQAQVGRARACSVARCDVDRRLEVTCQPVKPVERLIELCEPEPEQPKDCVQLSGRPTEDEDARSLGDSSSGFGASSEGTGAQANSEASSLSPRSLASLLRPLAPAQRCPPLIIENDHYAPLGHYRAESRWREQPAYANLYANLYARVSGCEKQSTNEQPCYAIPIKKSTVKKIPSDCSLDSGGFSRLAPIKQPAFMISSAPGANSTEFSEKVEAKRASRKNSLLRKFGSLVSRAFQPQATEPTTPTAQHQENQNLSRSEPELKLRDIKVRSRIEAPSSEQQPDLVILAPRSGKLLNQRTQVAHRIRSISKKRSGLRTRPRQRQSSEDSTSCSSRTSCSGSFSPENQCLLSRSEAELASRRLPARARLIQVDCSRRSRKSLRKPSEDEHAEVRKRADSCRSQRKPAQNHVARHCKKRTAPTWGRLLSIDPVDSSQLLELERRDVNERWPFTLAPGSIQGVQGVFVSRLSAANQQTSGLLSVGDRIVALNGRPVSSERDFGWLCERTERSRRLELRLEPFQAN